MPNEGQQQQECDAAGCSNHGEHVCTGCRVTRYCSKDCQRTHWKNGGHKYECQISSETKRRGLANQEYMGGAHGFTLAEELPKAVFCLLRQRALESPYCIWRLYTLIKYAMRNDSTMLRLLPAVRKQLFAEYGTDPLQARDAPPVGEITDGDLTLLLQSLSQGQEEARLLLAQSPPNEALKKQNAFLGSDRSVRDSIQYVIFDPENIPVVLVCRKTVNIEVFKMLRKRASISPRCLGVMRDFLENFLIDTQTDPTYKARLKDLMQKQLQTVHGTDPYSSPCNEGDPASANDVCEEVARYTMATMVMTSPGE